jgi:hypothetical protein
MYVFVVVDVCGCEYVCACEIWILVVVKMLLWEKTKNMENFDLPGFHYVRWPSCGRQT